MCLEAQVHESFYGVDTMIASRQAKIFITLRPSNNLSRIQAHARRAWSLCAPINGYHLIMKSIKTENMKRFTKVIHEKMKTNNIFNDSNPNTMHRWASIIAANFQIGTVSPIKNWVSAFKECKALRYQFIFLAHTGLSLVEILDINHVIQMNSCK